MADLYIDIDDFPRYKPPFILGIFHGYVSHNQMLCRYAAIRFIWLSLRIDYPQIHW